MAEIKVSREKLEKIIKECWEEASNYTGEYWMGKADLANELLGNPEIDWDKHPRCAPPWWPGDPPRIPWNDEPSEVKWLTKKEEK